MNRFHEFVVDGTSVETVFVTHTKCGWEWLSYAKYGAGSIPLNELLQIVSEHVCEEGS